MLLMNDFIVVSMEILIICLLRDRITHFRSESLSVLARSSPSKTKLPAKLNRRSKSTLELEA